MDARQKKGIIRGSDDEDDAQWLTPYFDSHTSQPERVTLGAQLLRRQDSLRFTFENAASVGERQHLSGERVGDGSLRCLDCCRQIEGARGDLVADALDELESLYQRRSGPFGLSGAGCGHLAGDVMGG